MIQSKPNLKFGMVWPRFVKSRKGLDSSRRRRILASNEVEDRETNEQWFRGIIPISTRDAVFQGSGQPNCSGKSSIVLFVANVELHDVSKVRKENASP